MADPTSSLRIVLPTGDMTFSGNDDANPLGLISMSRLALIHRRAYADPSIHVRGGLMTQSVPDLTNLNVVVGLKGTGQSSLEAQEAALRAACSEKRTVVTERNGYETTLAADTAEMTPVEADDDYPNLRDFEAFYSLSFPVQPI